MKRLHIIISLLFLPITLLNSANAQIDIHKPNVADVVEDVRGRMEGVIEWGVTKDLSLEAGVEARLKNNIGSMDRIHTFVGATYDINKHIKIGGEYILINMYDSQIKGWESHRHRANLNVEGEVEAGDFEFSLRERVQTTFRTDSVNRYEKSNPEAILRSRLVATYKIPHSRWSPYLLFELHNTLNAPKAVANFKTDKYGVDNYVTRYRGGVGVKYRVDRDHRLDFYYYFDFDRSYNIDYKGNKGNLKGYILERELRHIFGISYKVKL